MPTEYTPSVNQDTQFQVIDRRKRGYFTIDNSIVDKLGAALGPYGFAVYACLCRFANRDEQCWPSRATIAQRMSISTKQVDRELTKLLDLGLILITPRYNPETKEHSSNLYTLLDVEGSDSQTPPRVRQSPRTKHSKKDPGPKNKQEELNSAADRRRAYVPDEYADIINH